MIDPHTTILPYDQNWPSKFESEKILIERMLGEYILAIEHIGSTSIPGLPSKPIIDMAVVINDPANASKIEDKLKNAGYIFHSESTERKFYRKGNPIEFHLSITFLDRGGFLPRQLIFRDYLRSHPKAKNEYGNLKRKLLNRDPTGTDEYLSGKSDFVLNILNAANWRDGETYLDYLK